ncbi:MAG: hypothetical protein HZB19_05235 [Chloroflexi bacterium]|nr:hypothetical protein [Chloroflexota bacterium]
MRGFYIFIGALIIVTLACDGGTPTVPSTPQDSIFDSSQTAYGFFPSPPEVTLESVMQMYKDLGDHADVVLLQQNIPWEAFAQSAEVESGDITDIKNQHILAVQNSLEIIFVVDPLNGLNRREFLGLPSGWEASFANPDVRTAYKNYTLRVVREFHPRYLGLASEINTYADAHPEDFPTFLSLYNEVYDAVKAEAPQTQIFVTFQWEDLNNIFPQPNEGNRQKFDINWDQVEIFEPKLDLWAISSYPFVAFENASDIPPDYYTPLLSRTSKPVAVAEGGFASRDIDPFHGDPQDQVDYLNAIHTQIGERLNFWIYLLLTDFNMDSYEPLMRAQGQGDDDINTLGLFASVGLREFDGTPKPALDVWDGFRDGR